MAMAMYIFQSQSNSTLRIRNWNHQSDARYRPRRRRRANSLVRRKMRVLADIESWSSSWFAQRYPWIKDLFSNHLVRKVDGTLIGEVCNQHEGLTFLPNRTVNLWRVMHFLYLKFWLEARGVDRQNTRNRLTMWFARHHFISLISQSLCASAYPNSAENYW